MHMHRAILVAFVVAATASAEYIYLPTGSVAIVNNQISFTPFDPSLGTLTGVDLRMSIDLSALYTFAVLPGTPSWATLTGVHARIGFLGVAPGFLHRLPASADVLDVNYAPITLELRSRAGGQVFWSSDLGGFAGADPWKMTLYPSIQYYFYDIPPGVYQTAGSFTMSDAWASLQYEYTPSEQITHAPEPGYYLVVGLGLLGLVVARRRRHG